MKLYIIDKDKPTQALMESVIDKKNAGTLKVKLDDPKKMQQLLEFTIARNKKYAIEICSGIEKFSGKAVTFITVLTSRKDIQAYMAETLPDRTEKQWYSIDPQKWREFKRDLSGYVADVHQYFPTAPKVVATPAAQLFKTAATAAPVPAAKQTVTAPNPRTPLTDPHAPLLGPKNEEGSKACCSPRCIIQ